MIKLPILSGKELCKALIRIGYLIDHQTGSHIILRNENLPHRRYRSAKLTRPCSDKLTHLSEKGHLKTYKILQKVHTYELLKNIT